MYLLNVFILIALIRDFLKQPLVAFKTLSLFKTITKNTAYIVLSSNLLMLLIASQVGVHC